MILTFSEAKLLLQQLNIPSILQQKILILFLSYGTPCANIIKKECLKLHLISFYKDSIKTLWRLKLHNSNYSIIKDYFDIVNKTYSDLSDAAFYPFPHSNFIQNKPIDIFIKNHLYSMFYNLDKFYYGEYGTPTANIIRNAIRNNTIKCSK